MSLSEKLEAARIALGKRKERELQQLGPAPAPAPTKAAELSAKPARAGNNNNNKLLAGNLAHEFLTHGTLLGRRIEPSHHHHPPAPAAPRPEPEPKRRYAELSWLLMTNGAHIPGVVNPTQLGRWLQIKE
ncbi:uncharacterized protein LOC123430528 [Hordeum vulgare subsp. vulgare]|uniref:Uncharacterized protein n=1 Tax=Hordeum vulgare subsp. vulgare TaxID=112509 RepID=A0A8I6WW19_HORVV|nr:uncharacterized protein LOC123430528 [Hordeum vulgare subsp. vulgare]